MKNTMIQAITEGKGKISAFVDEKISKKLPVFYNPLMEFNRTSSINLLNNIGKKEIRIALPMAGSGIRGIRFLKELKKGIVKELYINDYSEKAIENILDNLISNNIIKSRKTIPKNIILSNKEANLFMLESSGFDYIDIDPFGSPNKFIDSAVKRISRGGILAVTATDTSALAGTYPKACKRKYWATPLRDELKHEIGIRILIRKIQLISAQYDKALQPVLSFSKDHYMRLYLECKKGKVAVDEMLELHGKFKESGPLWLGRLHDSRLLNKIRKASDDPFYDILYQESKIDTIGFYSLPHICKRLKYGPIPRKQGLIDKIISMRYRCSPTHFDNQSIKTDMPEEELINLIKTFK